MSLENAAAFLARLDTDSALSERVQSREDAVAVAAELNTPFTLDELETAVQERNDNLGPDDLKNVAGGRVFV
jgi:predicted ribosomally synthesized peptide with nif11-like leader